jgi:hypothetical protein
MNHTQATATSHTNHLAIAAFMDDMAIQMDLSADTIRNSAQGTLVGDKMSEAAVEIQERASKIRVITQKFRDHGDLDCFDQACKIVGWRPKGAALESLMAGVTSNTLQ